MEEWREPLLGDKELREIGDNIREKRMANGWTQEDLAGFMNSDRRVVSRHENGHGMNLELLLRYACVFRCPVTALLPEKFREGLSMKMTETLALVAGLSEAQQNIIAAMIKNAIELAA